MIADREEVPRIGAHEHKSNRLVIDPRSSALIRGKALLFFPDPNDQRIQKHTGGGLANALSVEYQPFTPIEGTWRANQEKNARSCTW